MNPTTLADLMDALSANYSTPYSRPVRVCVRGQKGFRYVNMAGGVGVPRTMESEKEVDALMRERAAVGQS